MDITSKQYEDKTKVKLQKMQPLEKGKTWLFSEFKRCLGNLPDVIYVFIHNFIFSEHIVIKKYLR